MQSVKKTDQSLARTLLRNIAFDRIEAKNSEPAKNEMKRVLAVQTPVGGVVHIVPCEQNGAAVALNWRSTLLTDAEKEASRLYLFDEGFIEHAAGTLEPDAEIERFLKGIPEIF
jgi:hypothetical protein